MKVVTNRLLMIHKTTRYVLNWSPKNSESVSCQRGHNIGSFRVRWPHPIQPVCLSACRASLWQIPPSLVVDLVIAASSPEDLSSCNSWLRLSRNLQLGGKEGRGARGRCKGGCRCRGAAGADDRETFAQCSYLVQFAVMETGRGYSRKRSHVSLVQNSSKIYHHMAKKLQNVTTPR